MNVKNNDACDVTKNASIRVAVNWYRDFWTRSGSFERYRKFPVSSLTKQNTFQIQKRKKSSYYYEHVRLKTERNIKIDVCFLCAELRHEIPRTEMRLASNPPVSNSRIFSTTDAALCCTIGSSWWPHAYVRLSVIDRFPLPTAPVLRAGRHRSNFTDFKLSSLAETSHLCRKSWRSVSLLPVQVMASNLLSETGYPW
jgi:hypothetical protein